MTDLDSLTRGRQFVNMGKPGMISSPLKICASLCNPLIHWVAGLLRYTLCVFKGWQRRNSFRYGFARPPPDSKLIQQPPTSLPWLALESQKVQLSVPSKRMSFPIRPVRRQKCSHIYMRWPDRVEHSPSLRVKNYWWKVR